MGFNLFFYRFARGERPGIPPGGPGPGDYDADINKVSVNKQ